ncbi:DUF2786 domain-containing protein [Haloactinopolyspora sp.]|uniref:DUF2786 domain-containing protein n=1 Tax=Haloactinopolyspora sp. TaxID=1966353 RepID=UPI00260929A9|nr:DUF2786 domain-containing protein [Haloactinopolyspora sp.]
MGQRNQQKRAATKRRQQRQRRGSTPRSGAGASPGPYGSGSTGPNPFGIAADDRFETSAPSAEALAKVVFMAGQHQASGVKDAARTCAAELSAQYAPRHDRTLATAAGLALSRVITALWRSGWLPVDVWEVVRRRADQEVTGLLVDTIAADTAQHAPATVHQRWADQVTRLEATVWWPKNEPHLGPWARRHGVGTQHALFVTTTLLAQLMVLPKLAPILPPPGSASARVTAAGARVDQKVLARVRALLAKAESTQFPDEAEALSAKAQELMNRHAFERALLDADHDVQPAATALRLWLDSPYVEAKSHLVAAIAGANRCKSVFYPKLGFVALVGETMDLEITELLATSLLVQATHAMLAEGNHVTGAGTSRTRSFRRSFLVSYANRIGERLSEAGQRAHDPADDARLLPVLAARSQAVEDTFNEMFEHTIRKSVTVSNGAGWDAGRAAADRADLGVERQQIRGGGS